jgi:hypothetical protein
MQVTVPGNVYSFGVVLLEILTSKLPADEGFGEGVDLVRWVHTALERGETPEQIMDARLSTVSFAWHSCSQCSRSLCCVQSVLRRSGQR